MECCQRRSPALSGQFSNRTTKRKERIIDSALNNLELNTEALRDQYIESERLRRLQVDLEMEKQLGAAGQEFDSTLSNLAYRSAESQISTGQRFKNYALARSTTSRRSISTTQSSKPTSTTDRCSPQFQQHGSRGWLYEINQESRHSG